MYGVVGCIYASSVIARWQHHAMGSDFRIIQQHGTEYRADVLFAGPYFA